MRECVPSQHRTTLAIAMLATILIVGGGVKPAEAIPVFYSWGGETILKISDFPDTQDFQTAEGHFVDAGAIYKQITIFFLPLWNYDVRWAGYIDSETYVELSRDELEELARLAQISLPQDLVLPFWERYGGKLVLLLLLLVFLLYMALPDTEQPTDNNV